MQLAGSYDPKFGGYGSAPKFPRPVENCVMLYKFRKHLESGQVSESQNIMKMITHTLQCMARGGVHDHVGGGFHRYSVDECWHGKFKAKFSVIPLCGIPLTYLLSVFSPAF